jgi:hypothetical protein
MGCIRALKTLHSATDKKASMQKVLEAAVPEPNLRERVDAEAPALTDIATASGSATMSRAR